VLASQSEIRIMAGDIQQAFAGSMVNSITQWAQAIGEGRNVIRSTWDMARGFASDFLRQLAMMLLQALALKAAMKLGFGKVAGGMNSLLNVAPMMIAGQTMKSAGDKVVAGGLTVAAGAIALGTSAAALMAAAQMLAAANAAGSAGIFHSGGIVGAGGAVRSVTSSMFAAAARYHTGGIVGLRPREIPAILERGEEVLTRGDPRHILNGGGAAAGGQGDRPVDLTIVNAIDAGDFVSKGLATRPGQRALLNFIRANPGAVQSALGGGRG
jgi:hypothetical protein